MKPELALVVEPAPGRAGVSTPQLQAALAEAAEGWNRALARSRAPRIRFRPGAATKAVRQDGVSEIVLRASSWCPAAARDEADCFDKRESALTHLYPVDAPGSDRDGELDEADIEINAVDFDWSSDRDPTAHARLRAVLAHELGHALGLDHSCVPFPTARPLGAGLPVRAPCVDPTSKVSIMYPNPIEPGRPLVLAPGDDEIATLTAIYPRTSAGCGCAIGSRRRSNGATVTAFVLSAFFVARRRQPPPGECG